MSDFGSKVCWGILGSLVVVTAPVWGTAMLIGKGLEKMGVDNPKLDRSEGYDPTAPENQIY